jgi:hypothetical protein
VANGAFKTYGRRRLAGLAAALLACALASAAMASRASAETLVVTSLKDNGEPGSLRETIKEAAADSRIVVPAGEIALTSGPLEVTKNLTIVGAGSGATTISGSDTWRVFTIEITGTPNMTLEGMTINDGKAQEGAGLKASGGLTLQDVVVTGNHAGGGVGEALGGGLDLEAGTYELIESAVTGNTAGGEALGAGRGGGIEYTASGVAEPFSLTLARSRVSGNHAGGGALQASGRGAGIDAESNLMEGKMSITLSESSVSGNMAGGGGAEKASGSGGGIEIAGAGEKANVSVTIDRSAITGNVAGGNGVEASGSGGGIDYSLGGLDATQALRITNTTIANNRAGGTGEKADGSGGGLRFGSGTATLSHLTVAGNSAGGGGGTSLGGGLDVESAGSVGIDNSILAANSGGNCAGTIPSGGHNIDDATSCGFASTGDRVGVDAKLGPLGAHGGPSLTQMPLAGSPAIDAADPATCPGSDQRGVARPQGDGCDIGAVEVARPTIATGSVSSLGSESATITGASITPNFSATSFHVDYGTTSAYGNFTAATSAGEGGGAQPVAAALSRLKPQTLYHFRFVASNAAGTVVSGDQTFTTSRATVAAVPVIKPAVTPPPTFSSVSLTNKRFRVSSKATAISARGIAAARRAPKGTRFRFRLSAAAKVQIVITRSAGGLRKGRSCVAPTAKLRRAHAKKCTRTLTVGKLIRKSMRAGSNAIAFSGRIGTRPLSPRAYRAVLSASNAGGRAKPVTLSFTVVR